jgi:hypothetical protein
LGLTADDISLDWVTALCRELANHDSQDVEVSSYHLSELGDAQGVISRYEKSTHEAIVGHRVLTIHWLLAGKRMEHRVVLKSKVPGSVIRRRLEEVYRRLDPRLADLQTLLSPSILDDCHTRELHIYGLDRASLKSITPAIHRVWLDEQSQIFVIVMELLDNMRHANTLNDLDAWLPRDIECALSQLARVHGDFLGMSGTSPAAWLVPFDQLNNARLADYEVALLAYNADAFPDLFDRARTRIIESLLASAAARHRQILTRPLTMIHGDFTPRNVCLKPGLALCAYDWELAQVHLPQRDVCEFLCYVLNPNRGWSDELTSRFLAGHRAAVAAASGRMIDKADYDQDLALAIAELCTFKLLVQGVTHQLLGNRYYFERLVKNAFDGVEAHIKEAIP